MKKYPVLAAFDRNEKGFLSAWCPFCARWHHHGQGEGHKVAHCTEPDSPLKSTGYVLKKVKMPKE